MVLFCSDSWGQGVESPGTARVAANHLEHSMGVRGVFLILH